MTLPDWAVELNNDLVVAELYRCSVLEVRRLDFTEYTRALIFHDGKQQAEKVIANAGNKKKTFVN